MFVAVRAKTFRSVGWPLFCAFRRVGEVPIPVQRLNIKSTSKNVPRPLSKVKRVFKRVTFLPLRSDRPGMA
jgi:hypothetical protein